MLVGCRTLCISDAERQRVGKSSFLRFFRDHISDGLHERFRIRNVLRFGDYDKFVASPARDKTVIQPSDVLKCFGDGFDCVIAFQMSVRIVDMFETCLLYTSDAADEL